jgi:HK97 family phage portal protein
MRLLPRLNLPRLLPQSRYDPASDDVWVIGQDGKPQALKALNFEQVQNARIMTADPGGVGSEWAPKVYGEIVAKSTPAYRAVTLRASAVRSAPLKVHRTLSDGTSEPVPDHDLQNLLNRVNEWWTGADLMYATELYLSIWGSCFWWLEGASETSLPDKIWPLKPSDVKIVVGKGDEYIRGFNYEVNGRRLPLLPEEVVWFRYINPNDEYAGLSPMASARLGVELGQDALTYNKAFFKNSAIPADIVFLANGPLKESQVKDFYQRLEARFKGVQKAHLPMMWDMSKGGKPERLGVSQKDMEYLGTLNYSVEEAARGWGVPPPLLMSQQTSTYNNVLEARIQFYTSTVQEEWKFLEAELNELLLPHANDDRLYVSFDTSGILPLKEAMAEIEGAQRADVTAGILTINEVRGLRNMGSVAWGDVFWAPGGLTPVEDAEVPELQEAPEEEPLGDDNELPEDAPPDDVEESYRLKSISQNRVETVLKAFDTRLTAAEKRFKAMQLDLFSRQKADVLRKVRLLSSKDISAIAVTRAPGGLFTPEDWAEDFINRGRPLMAQILMTEAMSHMSEFGLGTFDARDKANEDFVTDRADFWEHRANRETASLLAEEIEAGFAAGESIPELQARVNRVFDFNDVVRSERIARTETLVLANKGHLAAYEQTNVVAEKEWLTSIDDRTRDAHIFANGQRVPKDAPFLVGGESLQAPGIGGSASNVVNCRCTVAPIVDESLIGRSSPAGRSAEVAGTV